VKYVGLDCAYRTVQWCALAGGALGGEGQIPANRDGLARLCRGRQGAPTAGHPRWSADRGRESEGSPLHIMAKEDGQWRLVGAQNTVVLDS
jgi:hypothetical protein